MSRYNEYAKRLDVAFQTASTKQSKAWNEYQKATQAGKNPKTRAEKKETDAGLKEAKDKLIDATKDAWTEFRNSRDKIGRELQKAVNTARAADPDALDDSAVKLLDSMKLTPDDLASMAQKYSDNPTMMRMIGQKATEMSDSAENPIDRVQLNKIAQSGNNSDTLTAWNNLCEISEHYSGERQTKIDPEYNCRVNQHWSDQNVRDAIEHF